MCAWIECWVSQVFASSPLHEDPILAFPRVDTYTKRLGVDDKFTILPTAMSLTSPLNGKVMSKSSCIDFLPTQRSLCHSNTYLYVPGRSPM